MVLATIISIKAVTQGTAFDKCAIPALHRPNSATNSVAGDMTTLYI